MKYLHPTRIPRSKFFSGLDRIGERTVCADTNVKGDTYPVAWGDDDELYAGVGDPVTAVEEGKFLKLNDMTPEQKEKQYNSYCGLVVDKISGEAEQFCVSRVNDMPGYIGWGGHGPKPTGMISSDGDLYLVAQNLLGWKPPRYGNNSQHGSDATILKSSDHGKTWSPDLTEMLLNMENEQFDRGTGKWRTPPEQRAVYKDWTPMFPGNLFGGASFVQYGRNNEAAIDGYIYAVSSDQWDNGTEMRLGRVPKNQIMNIAAWEYAVLKDDIGNVSWTSNLYESTAVLSVDRHISVPEMIYLPSVKKYVLATWALHTDFYASDGSELTVLESDNPWGPFYLVHYEWMWYKEEAGFYCPRIPLKWFDEQTMEGHMLISGNWITQTKYYLPQTMKFRLNMRAK